jgi:rare lipoprotein A
MKSLYAPFSSLKIALAVTAIALLASGCAAPRVTSEPATETGIASYYSNDFQGRKTSDGEIFDNSKFTAAHRTYPFGTVVKVTNLATDATVEVRINDRGPVKKERVIDLSFAAAKAIGIDRMGLGRVRIDVVTWGRV